jgi:hypothetical protein
MFFFEKKNQKTFSLGYERLVSGSSAREDETTASRFEATCRALVMLERRRMSQAGQ